jgi:hypothetical protein
MAHVAQLKYIHRLTGEYTWASKLPALLFPSVLCLILKRPHVLNVARHHRLYGRCPRAPPHVPRAGYRRLRHPRPELASVAATHGCCRPRPELASPLPAGAAPGAPGP